jgi:hypothetical protein
MKRTIAVATLAVIAMVTVAIGIRMGWTSTDHLRTANVSTVHHVSLSPLSTRSITPTTTATTVPTVTTTMPPVATTVPPVTIVTIPPTHTAQPMVTKATPSQAPAVPPAVSPTTTEVAPTTTTVPPPFCTVYVRAIDSGPGAPFNVPVYGGDCNSATGIAAQDGGVVSTGTSDGSNS